VDADDPTAGTVYVSAADSGYSVDNLPPLPPAPLTGAAGGGATAIHWGPNLEPDLAGYRLYRGTAADFTPGPGNLVVAKGDTGHVDAGHVGWYYKLSAVDVHGNESAFALLTPEQTTGVGETGLPRALSLAAPRPNPASGLVHFRIELPGASLMRLSLVDVAGRRIALIREESLPVGAHDVVWNRDGDVRPGLYFVRLETAHGRLERKLTLMP
jgi:hypothetical protein